ncbi:YlaH-like family protein [Alteribacter natronophilus]|uniref:YlaH-like family protein n=1 Tax=Alteribacter natronophilus TaxID=2583810 RepID=UPI00110D4251|nr:YlaH-like family protein [Alteribacter natronophilus]TMW73049.1 hypothetical protein FGB90_01700 [Alteribacter natronophilus]
MLYTAAAQQTNFNVSPMADFIGGSNPENFAFVFPVLYLIVTVLSIIVFNLGFARKLPLLKNIIVYTVMIIGNILLTVLAIFLPIAESLIVAALVLGIYRLRMKQRRDENQQNPVETDGEAK